MFSQMLRGERAFDFPRQAPHFSGLDGVSFFSLGLWNENQLFLGLVIFAINMGMEVNKLDLTRNIHAEFICVRFWHSSGSNISMIGERLKYTEKMSYIHGQFAAKVAPNNFFILFWECSEKNLMYI